MDRSNLKDQEKPPTAPPRPHHSITTGPTQLPPSPNTRQPAQPSAVTASPTIRPSPQATPKDTSHLASFDPEDLWAAIVACDLAINRESDPLGGNDERRDLRTGATGE